MSAPDVPVHGHIAESVLAKFEDDPGGLHQQVHLLSVYLIEKYGGPWRSMGAIEMAIRLLEGEHSDGTEVQ